MEDDWRCKQASFKDSLSCIFKTKLLSDCSFAAEDDTGRQRIFATHKLVLAIASPVFETMFYGSLPEKADAPIELAEIGAEAFEVFLSLIYGCDTPLASITLAQKVYYVADKYMVESIKKNCIEYILKSINAKTVSEIYVFAEKMSEPKLLKKCVELFENETSEILKSGNFPNLNYETFSAILDQGMLNIWSENELFEVLENYAFYLFRKIACGDDKTAVIEAAYIEIRKLVKKIRFLLFEQHEFQRFALSQLLTIEESVSIMTCIENATVVSTVYPEEFTKNTHERCCVG